MLNAFIAVLSRDLRLAIRRRGDWINPLVFFVIVITLFPLGIGPDTELLRQIAPGILWVAALLATLLASETLFRPDYDDGSLEQLVLCGQPLSVLVLAKVLAHWLITGLPLLLLSPLMAVVLQLQWASIPALMGALLLGTLTLSFVAAIGAALTVGLRRGGVLLALLVLPLFIPVLIFGSSALLAAEGGFPVQGHLSLLGALFLLSLAFSPLAIAASLRIIYE